MWSPKGCFGNDVWWTRLTTIVRNSTQPWSSLRRLAFAKGKIGSTNSLLRRRNISIRVCISSPQCFSCPSRWYVDTEDDKEESPRHRTSLWKAGCDASADFLVESFSFTVAYVDLDIAGKRMAEIDAQQFSCHWPRDDESMLPIVTSIVDTSAKCILVTGSLQQCISKM